MRTLVHPGPDCALSSTVADATVVVDTGVAVSAMAAGAITFHLLKRRLGIYTAAECVTIRHFFVECDVFGSMTSAVWACFFGPFSKLSSSLSLSSALKKGWFLSNHIELGAWDSTRQGVGLH